MKNEIDPNMRVHYLRGKPQVEKNNPSKKHRGAPIAVIITHFDRSISTISYAVAAIHPTDHFVKKTARHIAIERIFGVDRRGKRKTNRNSGARVLTGPEVYNILRMGSDEGRGHAITKLVMSDIRLCMYHPQSVRDAAKKWLKTAEVPRKEVSNTLLPPRTLEDMSDKLPTIPVPREHALPARIRVETDPGKDVVYEPVARHGTILPPPPSTYGSSNWTQGRNITEINAIHKAKAMCNPNISMDVVVKWYDAAKERGFDGSVRFPDPELPNGPNLREQGPASSRA